MDNGALYDSTRQVFDDCAPVYLAEDKHWGADLDIIRKSSDLHRPADVIELGTGHAWHLANLFRIASSSVSRLVGIDYSSQMLKQAQSLLREVEFKGIALEEKVELLQCDMLDLERFARSFDVALCLNNTLGNIPGSDSTSAANRRGAALAEAGRVLRPEGKLVLSVYNANRISTENQYGEVFGVDIDASDRKSHDYIVEFYPTNSRYYSHWFFESEISHLLQENGFEIDILETRQKRIVCMATNSGTP
jgi:SAM-dependent methyltransferase